MKISHKFVDNIPDEIDEGTIYISLKYNTAIHKCACGCGKEVVTPFSPVNWSFSYNGKDVSLRPSIGNWSFDCRSHYWIKNGHIQWAGSISTEAAKNLSLSESKQLHEEYSQPTICSKIKSFFK